MKKLILAIAVAIASISVSCENKSSTNVETTPSDSVTVPENHEAVESTTMQTCYVGVSGKDSVFVSLDDNLGTIIGKMRYKNFEKDSSTGDISGMQNGDTLKLTYAFESEGMSSEREIYFLKKDGKIIEGIGDHQTEGNKDFYAEPKKLKYEGHTLQQADCTDFDKKFAKK